MLVVEDGGYDARMGASAESRRGGVGALKVAAGV